MKRVNYILFALLTVVSFLACTPEVDDKFDQSSSQRIATAISNTKQVLESAPGWLMYYYGNTDYGGYNVYCKFANDQVTVQSEIFGDSAVTSGYKVEQSSGVVLSFDEYNEIFHFFSDPSLDKYGLSDIFGGNGKGFEGDLEFRVQSATADSVVLVGKKHQKHVLMIPVESSFSWQNYLSQVDATDESIFSSANYKLNLGTGTSYDVSQSNIHRMLTAVDANGNSHEMSYIVLPGKIKLYEPVTYGDKTVNEFSVDAGTVFTETSDNSVNLTKYAPPLVDQLIDGTWAINYSDMGELGQSLWDQTYTRETSRGFRCRYAYFGTYTISSSYGANFGIHIGSRQGTGTTYWGTIGLTATKLADDEITLSYNSEGNIVNGTYFYSTLRYYYLVSAFAGRPGHDPESRTFKITTDNPYNASYLTLTDENDPTNIITLTYNYYQWPYSH